MRLIIPGPYTGNGKQEAARLDSVEPAYAVLYDYGGGPAKMFVSGFSEDSGISREEQAIHSFRDYEFRLQRLSAEGLDKLGSLPVRNAFGDSLMYTQMFTPIDKEYYIC